MESKQRKIFQRFQFKVREILSFSPLNEWLRNQRLFVISPQMRMWFKGSAVVVLVGAVSIYNYYGSFNQLSNGRNLEGDGDCVPPADPAGLAVLYSLGVLYMFIALAIVAGTFSIFPVFAISL